MERYIVAVTGASGAVYGQRLAAALLARGFEVDLVITRPARLVIEQELGLDAAGFVAEIAAAGEGLPQSGPHGRLVVYEPDDLLASIASGSVRAAAMIVIPCSMSALSAIASGTAGNLVERAADVMIKERRPLVLVPRETPLSVIHLRNMLVLAEAGVHILPAMPGFYHHPQTVDELVDFVVGKVLNVLGIPQTLLPPWGGHSPSGLGEDEGGTTQ